MVGRDAAVQEISSSLAEKRFVTIVGPGGIGKTTVAVRVAHFLVSDFEGSVFFIDLGMLSEPGMITGTLISVLGLQGQQPDPINALIAFLRHRRVLLLLDNCEHLIDAIAVLAERIVDESPLVHILATSREPLRVEGEFVHRLTSLRWPAEPANITAEEALTYPAVQLFMERANASDSATELTDANAPVVSEMCLRLDGIALAIELAASRVGDYGVQGTARLLDNRFRLTWQGRRTALPRHQTLNAMLDWSYNLLSEEEQRVLRRLSVFVSDFTLEAALAVAMKADDDELPVANSLASLVTKSLLSVRVEDGLTYYRLLETTRAYGLAKLVENEEVRSTRLSQAAYFQHFLQSEGRSALPIRSLRSATAGQHLGNTRAALEWCFSEGGDIRAGVALAEKATPQLLKLSFLDECYHWSQMALDRLDQADRGTERELNLQETFAISAMFTKGNTTEVRQAIERGLLLAERLGDDHHQRQLLAGLNIFVTRIGDFAGALDVAHRNAAVARRMADPSAVIIADWMLGVAHHLVGDHAAAQHHCEAGFAHALEVSHVETNFFGYDHRVRALMALCRTLWLRGFPDRAAVVAQQAIDEAAAGDHPVTVCISLIYSAPVFLWSGNLPTAEKIITNLIAHAEKSSLAPYHAVGLGLRGELELARGNTGTALQLLYGALQVLEQEKHTLFDSIFTRAVAEGLLNIGQVEQALGSIDAALAIAGQSGGAFDMPELLRTKGLVLSNMDGGGSEAETCFRRALDLANEKSAKGWSLRAAICLEQLLSQRGQIEEAYAVLSRAYDEFTEGFETADLQLARRRIRWLERRRG